MRSKPSASASRVLGRAVILAGVLGVLPAARCETPFRRYVVEVSDDYSWGYRVGVKQPLGSYDGGLSVHQISRTVNIPVTGNPDHLMWVDESSGSRGIVERATGISDDAVVNPGGMATFHTAPPGDPRSGTIWFALGGRAHDMALDLYRSDEPYSVDGFGVVADDFETSISSTTPCVNALGDRVLLTWRHDNSASMFVKIRTRLYDADGDFTTPIWERDIGSGVRDPDLGVYGIEQHWTRLDPRFERLFLTWQYFHVDSHTFGSNPFLYSDDFGETWRRADGSALGETPIDYTEIDPVFVPQDHLANGENTGWYVRDIGVSPGGVNWMAVPSGDIKVAGGWFVNLLMFRDGAWEERAMTPGMPAVTKPHALGVTRDYMVFAYAKRGDTQNLWMTVSDDDGLSWRDPVRIDRLVPTADGDQSICWVSFVQPASEYEDNTARFFYAHFNRSDGSDGRNYMNKMRWISVDLDSSCRTDFDRDGMLTGRDFAAYLNAFVGGDPNADYNIDGYVNSIDFMTFLNAFLAGC
jgi:hypothetical protein